MIRLLRPIGRAMAAAAALAGITAAAGAQEIKFFRIGTGSISGVYFPVGGLIASAISHPPGASLCGQGGSCGVPGMVAVAQASRGSISNVRDIAAGRVESALVQADVAYLAVHGKAPFAGGKAVPGLRAIASLYPEAVHVVVRRDSPIRSIGDLRGRRISLDLKGSGTRVVARVVLQGYGVGPKAVDHLNSQVGPAVDRLRSRQIDAFFFVGGYPVPSIVRLAQDVPVRLLPVAGREAEAIGKAHPFLYEVEIPARVYRREAATRTLAVAAHLVVSETVRADLVYDVTKALWHPTTRHILDQGPPATRQMRLESAVKGLAIALHDGAARFYREKGLLEKPGPGPAPESEKAAPAAPENPAPAAKKSPR